MENWKLVIIDATEKEFQVSLEKMEELKDSSIPVEEYVPRKQAEAVYLSTLFQHFSIASSYTNILFQAEDGFSQKVKKEDCDQAFLVFKHKGELLTKGFPVRLYVPGNESDCLNVKSVVRIQLVHE